MHMRERRWKIIVQNILQEEPLFVSFFYSVHLLTVQIMSCSVFGTISSLFMQHLAYKQWFRFKEDRF